MITENAYRATDPETCAMAAAAASHGAAESRALALDALRKNPGGLTDFELAEITGYQQTSIGKRRGELRDEALVADSGLRRAAPSGRSAIVWKAV